MSQAFSGKKQLYNPHSGTGLKRPICSIPAAVPSRMKEVPKSLSNCPVRITALTFGADRRRQEVDVDCETRYISCIVLTLSDNLDLDKSEISLKRKQDSCIYSTNESQRCKTVGSSSQVNKPTSLPDTSRGVTRESSIPQKIPFLAGLQPRTTVCGSTDLDQTIKDCANREKQTDVEELSDPSEVMLSSAMATVLAPTWSGRLRRSKRFEATGNLETLASLPGVANSEALPHPQDYSQGSQSGAGRVFNISQEPSRGMFLRTRQNTTGWSTKSGPQNLDYELESKVARTISLDGRSKEREIKKAQASSTWDLYGQKRSPQDGQNTTGWSTKSGPQNLDYELESKVARTISLDGSSKEREIKKAQPSSTWDICGQKRSPQDGHPVQRSSLSSKPTTSSLLLSLRRINNKQQSMTSNNPTPTEVKPVSLKSGQDAKLFTTQMPQTFHKTLERERFKPLPSSLAVSPRAPEMQPVSSPLSTNHIKRGTSKTSLFSSSTISKATTDTPKQPQTINPHAQPNLSCSRQVFLSQQPSDNEDNWIDSGRGLKLFSDSAASPHKRTQYDSGVVSDSCAPYKNTPGSASSTWQQNSQKGSPTPVLTGTPNIINKPNTPLIPLFKNNCEIPALSLTNNKSLNCQISNSSSNRATAEPVCNDSVNPVMKPQKGGPGRVKERDSAYSLDRVKLAKQLHESSFKKLELQKSQHFLDRHPSLSQPRDSIKHDVSNGYFKAHVIEFTTTSENKYGNAQSSLITNNTHQSKTVKQLSSLDSTSTLKSQVVSSKNICGLSQNENASPSFQSKPDSFQTGSTSQISKVPSTANTTTTTITTPLGFIRSYAVTVKPFQPEAVSHLAPMVNDSSKTNCSPASMTASPATTTTASQITSTTTPAITSRPQTSPATTISPNRKLGGILTNQSEKENKKSGPGLGKRVKHVMWEDSENSEPSKSPDPSVLTSPLSRSRSQRLIRAPSIFSFLRLSSQNTKNTPLYTTSRKTTNLPVEKGEKYRPLSSDMGEGGESKQNHSDAMSFDQERREATPCRLQRSRSLQGDEFLYYTTALSASSDFSNGYKIRYSAPPYSSLISSRGETKKATPRTPLFQNVNSNSSYTSNHPLHSHPLADSISPHSKTPLINSPKPLSSPPQNKMLSHENVRYAVSQTDEINNNNYKRICRNQKNGRILFIESRVDIIPQTLQSSKIDITASVPKNTKPESSQPFTKTLPSMEAKPSEQSRSTLSHSNQSSSGSSSTESRSLADEVSNKRMKESVMSKFKLFSADSKNEQSPKRRRFVKKKSVSTPNSENEKANKTTNKMDQVINKLRQTFGTKRPDDEPSGSGLSDTSNTSNATVESNRIYEREEQEAEAKDNERANHCDESTQNRYSLTPTLSVQNCMTENELLNWPDQSNTKDQDKLSFCPTKLSDQNDINNRATNQILLCVDPSLSRSPNLTSGHCTKVRKSTSSSKSPFSPFSLSTHSPFSSHDVADDSVFFSPKMQRRRETSSPCEPGEGISLVSSRRSRASTGPPSTGPVKGEASSYADLKYGIEPGRSVSVSSVLSSRPSRPGRISTGPRFMSVGDLSESVPIYGKADGDFKQWLERNCNHRSIRQMQSNFPSDDGKVRSRSLPRSLTRRLAHWSSCGSVCPPADTTASMSPHRWSPNMNTCHFDWDTVSPPTPPPTPPLSPEPRRMSKPASLPLPNFPSPTAEPLESQSPRGHLPSRDYVSSLSTFEESSDSCSDTTTDDEYYLEKSDDEEKETEL